MKVALTFGFIFLFGSVYCQADTIVKGVRYNHIKYYSNGTVKELGNLNGRNKKTGRWKIFDEKGSCTSSGSFRNDKKHGRWSDDGSNGRYRKGKQVGLWYLYSSCGFTKTKYSRSGKIRYRAIGHFRR